MKDCKNFFVRSLYRIKHNQGGCTPWQLNNTFNIYKQMQMLSIESFQKNLLGEWKLIELDGKFESLQQSWIDIIKQIQQLWHNHYPCNILWADTDTLCVKPLDIFDKFQEFRIFTDRDPLEQHQYHNAGVKYYPASIQSTFWDQMQQELDNWDFNIYDTEQRVHTKLMWAQPSLHLNINQKQEWVASQIGMMYEANDKNLGFESLTPHSLEKCILHFHSSRDPMGRLKWMQEVWDILKK